MGYLIVYAHPNPKSFCHAIKEKIEGIIKNKYGECLVRDLYAMQFNSVLSAGDFSAFSRHEIPEDIRKEQDLIRKAETVIFIHPVWWFNMPAILKGYIDRVFTKGFAYDYVGKIPKGLLRDKKVMIFSTTGGMRFAYYLLGFKFAVKKSIDVGVFNFCGMKVVLHKFFYAVPVISYSARSKMLSSIERIKF